MLQNPLPYRESMTNPLIIGHTDQHKEEEKLIINSPNPTHKTLVHTIICVVLNYNNQHPPTLVNFSLMQKKPSKKC